MHSNPSFVAPRFVCPQGEMSADDGDGFLLDPDGDASRYWQPRVLPLAAADAARCVVLVGEPGSGKSTALRHLSGEQVLWYDLAEFSSDSLLSQQVFGSSEIKTWRDSPGDELTLVLDSYDECLLRVGSLSTLLANSLGRLPVDRLKLRLGCRSAVWPRSLEGRLRDLFGDDSFEVYELLPLRRVDAAAAAAGAQLDGDAFLDEVVRREVGSLAARPVTLDFLLAEYGQKGQLPDSQVELYRLGCTRLASEPGVARRDAGAAGSLSPAHRVEVAGRIAAAAMLCSRPLISVHPGPTADGRLDPADFAADRGDTGAALTASGVREVLDTGLFAAAGAGLVEFGHRTYAEYLAADGLARSGQPSAVLFNLITARGRVATELREVAAWLATLRPDVLPLLIAADPEAALGCDLAAADPGSREAVAGALLGLARDGRYLAAWSARRARYARLAHAGLADQLRPTITDRAASIFARRFAIDVAEACRLEDLLPALRALALDPSESHPARVEAAYALTRVDGPGEVLALLPCTAGGAGDDADDELKGAALGALFPDSVGAQAVFATLAPPRQEGLIGAYRMFLDDYLPGRLPAADLPVALAWLARQERTWRPDWPFCTLAERLMERAWEALDDDAVLAAYAPIAVAYLTHAVDVPGLRPKDGPPDPARRWRVFDAVLPAVAQRARPSPWTCLIRLAGDAGAVGVLDRAATAPPESAERSCLAALAAYLLLNHPESLALLDRVTGPARALADQLLTVELDSDAARGSQESHAAYREWEETRRAAAAAREQSEAEAGVNLLANLDRSEAGSNDAWWRLNQAMLRGVGGELRADLRVSPEWKQADGQTRSRVVGAAARYLRAVIPEGEDPLAAGGVHMPDWAGVRALWLVAAVRPPDMDPVPPDVWARWAAPLVLFSCWGDDETVTTHRRLVGEAYAAAPDAILAAVDRLTRRPSRGVGFPADLFRDALDDRLAAHLLAHVRAGRVAGLGRRNVLRLLLRAGDAGAAGHLADAVRTDPRADALNAAALICELDPAAGWAAVWERVAGDEQFGRELFLALAAGDESRVAAGLSAAIDERAVGELYLWLARAFPREGDSSEEEDDSVSPRESVGHLRDALVAGLQQRATPEAAAELTRLAGLRPAEAWLRLAAERARAASAAAEWAPLRPADLSRLLVDPERRLIETADQLLAAVAESLGRLQGLLKGESPAAADLWNVVPEGQGEPPWCAPKDESHLSDYLARHIRADLGRRGVVVGREVEVRRGQRTDLHIDAVRRHPGGRSEVLTVIVEVKGCWNRGRETDLTGQLAERYIRENTCRRGLYVVGWFACNRWDPADRTERGGQTETAAAVWPRYAALAAAASTAGVRIEACVLDCGLHDPAGPVAPVRPRTRPGHKPGKSRPTPPAAKSRRRPGSGPAPAPPP